VSFSASDRLVLGWVCGLFPNACDALAIIRPETVMRWHRAGFQHQTGMKTKTNSSGGWRPFTSTALILFLLPPHRRQAQRAWFGTHD
jgi:hypothetical protein